MSKPFRITIGITGALVALVMAAIAVMSTPWFHRALEHRLIVALEGMTGGRVEVREFTFHPIVLQAIFNGLVIHGTEAPEAPPLFSARTVVLRLSPANLFHREVRIMSLDWDGAELHLKTNADGSTNLPGPITRYTAGQAMDQLFDLRIGRVTLARSTFFWNDRPLGLELSARDVALLLHFRRGPRYEGSLAASALTARGPAQSIPPVTLSTQFVLTPNELAVTSLVWQSRGMTGQGSSTFRAVPEPEASFSFQAGVDLAGLNPPPLLPGLQKGNLRLDGQGMFRRGQISVHGRLETRQLLFRDARFNSGPLEVSADYSLDRSQAAITNLRVLGWKGGVLGEGQVSLAGSTPQFHVRVRPRDVDLSAFLHGFTNRPLLVTQFHPASLVDGVADVTWSGDFEKFKSEFDLHFSAPAAPSPSFLPVNGDMRGSLEMNHGFSVSLEEASFHTPHSVLRAKGTLVESVARSQSPGRLQIECETEQFEEWRPVFEDLIESAQHLPLALKSQATFTGEVAGSIYSPDIRGSLRVGAFEYRGWTWDGLQANLVAQPDLVQISSGRLAHGASALSLEGTAHLENWRFTKTSLVQLSAHAARTPLEGFQAALGINYPIGGSVSGRLNLGGTASNLAGAGTLRVESGQIAGETVDSFSANVHVRESGWEFDTIELRKDHGRITGNTTLDAATHSITCQLRGAGFSLAELKTLAHAFPNSSLPSLQGQASFDFRGSGTPGNFHFHSTMLVQGIRAAGAPVGDFRVQLDGEGTNLRISGIGSGPAGMFSLSGDTTTTTGDWPVQLQGQYISFRLDPWARLLLNDSLSGQVTASGSFKANGSLRDPSKLRMQSEIQTLEVSLPFLKWRNEHPVELRLASGRLFAQPFRMQGPSTNLTVEGSLDVAGPASLSVTAQGIADATLLSLLDPSLQASGHSRVKLSASGSPLRPQLKGTMEVQDVSLFRAGLPFRLSNLNGEIEPRGGESRSEILKGHQRGRHRNPGWLHDADITAPG